MLKKKLKCIFGYDEFKNSLQETATEAAYNGKENIFINMPSGSGKSIIFQLPVVAKENSFAIVITPTIIKAKTQVNYLKSINIMAYCWNAYTPTKLKILIKKKMVSMKTKLKLLYITPEQYLTAHFQYILKGVKPNVLSYIVLEEADKISPLSDNFSLVYKKLLAKKLSYPFIAVTSTDHEQVKKDVLEVFQTTKPLEFSISPNRPNLFSNVWFSDCFSKLLLHLKYFIENCIDFEKKNKKSCGVIFCTHNDFAVKITDALESMGILAVFYNNYSRSEEKTEILNLWNSDQIQILVALFGTTIGMHKKFVRYVMHWGCPCSIKSHNQEISREKNDGDKSCCKMYCHFHQFCEKCDSNIQSDLHMMDKFLEAYGTQRHTKSVLIIHIAKNIFNYQYRHNLFSTYLEDSGSIQKSKCDVCQNKFNVEGNYSKSVKSPKLSQVTEFNKFSCENPLSAVISDIARSLPTDKTFSTVPWDLTAEKILKNIYGRKFLNVE